jgi:hypothetical protein
VLDLPEGYKDIGDIMSNFDHQIEPGAEEQLKTGQNYGSYPGWNFHGTVWWDGKKFNCKIMQYGSHTNTLEGDTLELIMEQACDKYGSQ